MKWLTELARREVAEEYEASPHDVEWVQTIAKLYHKLVPALQQYRILAAVPKNRFESSSRAQELIKPTMLRSLRVSSEGTLSLRLWIKSLCVLA